MPILSLIEPMFIRGSDVDEYLGVARPHLLKFSFEHKHKYRADSPDSYLHGRLVDWLPYIHYERTSYLG